MMRSLTWYTNIPKHCLGSACFFFFLLFISTEKDKAAVSILYEIFPETTVTVLPKIHILEDHVVPWMRRWHIGAVLMGRARC